MHATTSTFLQSARGSRGDMVQWHATGPGCISHIGCYVLTCLTGIRSVRAPRAARWAAIDRGAERCRFQQFLVLDFPRPRSERGVSWCGGMRAAQGTDGTSAATYRPFRPESEASACRARRTGLQSTGAPSAADFSNSSSCACKPVSSHAQAGLIANPSSRPNADSIDRGHEWTRPTPTMRARGALERSGRGGLGLGL